jgi:hypothetical protein
MAIFRNVAISLLRLLGYDSPIQGLRHFAYHADDAVKVVTEGPTLTTWARMK